jgi:membrane protein implicated in regulation of membrane protease activity
MLNPTLVWLIAGAILCLMELIFPSAFVEFMMGIAALLVAAVSLVLPNHTLLVALWLIFSTVLIILSRRFFTPKRRITELGDASEGETITAIAPGSTGRVLYEGNSWRAKCADPLTAIAPNQKIYVVGKEGNTLIVLPENLLHS